MTIYPLGKLPAEHLNRLLTSYNPRDSRLIMGSRVGEDAAVIAMGERYLVAKTDPITFATDQIGWYAVNVAANDVACTGAKPMWFLATLLLPENKTTPALVDDIFKQITTACEAHHITLVGGHTEITYGLDRPIVVGQMLGEVKPTRLVLNSGARVGDDLVLTKHLATEAVAIIAAEKHAELLDLFSAEDLDRLTNFLHDPGISVVPEAMLSSHFEGVHAMHDPTEGGIATGLHEMATSANVGLEIFQDALPYYPECLQLCQHFQLDPLGLIASGSLLIAVDRNQTASLLQELHRNNIQASRIGRIQALEFGRQLITASGESSPLPTFSRDEITRLFESETESNT